MNPRSFLILAVLMQLGSAVTLSLVPVWLRLRALEQALPRCDDPRMLASLPRRKFRWCSTSRVQDARLCRVLGARVFSLSLSLGRL